MHAHHARPSVINQTGVRRMEVSKDLVWGCLLYDFKVGLSATPSSHRICQAFENSAVDEHTVRRWFKKFKCGELT